VPPSPGRNLPARASGFRRAPGRRVPEAVTKSTLKQYRHSGAVTELEEFPDRGHSLTIDAGWAAVAELALTWLGKQGL
jgi:hypothetical protein